jgi:hypothetical protein
MVQAISDGVVQERKVLKTLSGNKRRHYEIARDAQLFAAIDRTDPIGTARYLVAVAMRLQDNEPLGGDVRNWLAKAIIETALNPRHAAAAFGLVHKPNRPRGEADYRASRIAARIKELSDAGRPIGLGSSASAIAKAAEEFGVSEAVAEKAWKNWPSIRKGK